MPNQSPARRRSWHKFLRDAMGFGTADRASTDESRD
jgi:hypothetical protein